MRLNFTPNDLASAMQCREFKFMPYTGAAGEVDLIDFVNEQSASVRKRTDSTDVKVQYELAGIRTMLARISKQVSRDYPDYMIVLIKGMNAGTFRLVNRHQYLTMKHFKNVT